MKTKSNIERMIMYLDGDLNSKEALEFEELLKYDVALNEEFNFAIELEAYFRDKRGEKFRESFLKAHLLYNEYEYVNQEINKTNPNLFMREVKKSYIRLYKVASILVFFFVSAVIITQLFSINLTRNEKLFAQYYQPYEGHYFNIAVISHIKNLQTAIIAYRDKQYRTAIEYFDKVMDLDNPVIFYKGISSIECKDYNLALNCFSQVLNNPSSPYYAQARWYMALTWLKLDMPDNAKIHLEWLKQNICYNHYYGEKASVLLKELDKK
jgi:tetratricopeptide (TPR) repeat protein